MSLGPQSEQSIMSEPLGSTSMSMQTRAGRNPTFQDPGTPLDGLVGKQESNTAGPRESYKVDP